MRRMSMAVALGAALLLGGAAQAKGHGGHKAGHPNLTAAEKALKQAESRLTKAQEANEFDLAGHAAKAKELLAQALQEIEQARQAAGQHDAKEHAEKSE